MRALIVNTGSSSVKLRIVQDHSVVEHTDLAAPDSRMRGHIKKFADHAGSVDVVAHRVVHGGSRFDRAVLIDDDTRGTFDELRDLAPLHLPPALGAIDTTRRLLPTVPHVACFDTAFHRSLPGKARTYAVPAAWAQKGQLRRYGFHGLSCAWATAQVSTLVSRPLTDLRITICHLGSGASVTAVAGGKSVDTTMGFTPLEGLVMATRSGDVDPGILLWALRSGLTPAQVESDLERCSGLLGLTGGRTSDMRELLAQRREADPVAEDAVGVYLHRLRAKIASMVSATEGTDVLVFTGGVGEHAAEIRADTCAGLRWLGIEIDRTANSSVSGGDTDISARRAQVRTLVVHAQEELQMALECGELL